MGQPRDPLPARLFIGMLTPEPPLFAACRQDLEAVYGPADAVSETAPWDHTDYYLAEMGPGLLRQFLFFRELIDPGGLAAVKRHTLSLEDRLRRNAEPGAPRRVNLDPGYVTEAKVVLATTKDFAHRIYIGQGIYAEATLRFDRDAGTFLSCEHTYPDFRAPRCRELFRQARAGLRRSMGKHA